MHLAHPWHGISPGDHAPAVVTVFIEMVPADTVKYEVDKVSGHLRLDRPQRYSSLCPAPYGFVPRTLCGERVGALAAARTGRPGLTGDGDPVDVCLLSERPINHGGVLATARPIGGLRMLDGNEADDKIVAVLEGDAAYGGLSELEACPPGLVDRLQHYFLTYKDMPGVAPRSAELMDVYGSREAGEVILRALADYRAVFGEAGAASAGGASR